MTFIILIVIVAVGFFTRKIWSGFLVELFAKKKNLPGRPEDIYFYPQGTKRSFTFNLEIEELGDGSVVIAIDKKKKSE